MFLIKIVPFFIILLLTQFTAADDKEIALKLLIEENAVLKQQLKQLKNLLGCDNTGLPKLNDSLEQLSQSVQQQQSHNQKILNKLLKILEEKQSTLNQAALSSQAIANSSKEKDNKNATTAIIKATPEPYQKKQPNKKISGQEDRFLPLKSIKPTTFQLVYETSIINENLEEQFFWEEGTSFTAKEQYGEYYKISGYFVDKKWVRAPEDLYVAVELSMKK